MPALKSRVKCRDTGATLVEKQKRPGNNAGRFIADQAIADLVGACCWVVSPNTKRRVYGSLGMAAEHVAYPFWGAE